MRLSWGDFAQIFSKHKYNRPKEYQIFIIGFCDSKWSSLQVLEVIKSSVKVNVAHIDKVIIVCSGRIEGAHVEAIKQFMIWLSFEKYKLKFCFIYNKSDGLSEEEKMENLSHMMNELGADNRAATFFHELDGSISSINLNINLGFPKKATYSEVAEYHETLTRVTLAQMPKKRIPVNESSCTILWFEMLLFEMIQLNLINN